MAMPHRSSAWPDNWQRKAGGGRATQSLAAPGPGRVHTTPKAGGSAWVNQVGGEIVSEHRKKETAVDRGREIAKDKATEHTIHKKDGTIGATNSHGNDPNPPKDQK
jgi:hypothetical protein